MNEAKKVQVLWAQREGAAFRAARRQAEREGSWTATAGWMLGSPFQLGYAIADEPITLIVEAEMGMTEACLDKLKSLITSPKVVCERQYQEPILVKAPKIVVVLSSVLQAEELPEWARDYNRFEPKEVPA